MPFINFKNQNILFMHVPKTGGTTVENWLASLAPVQLSANYSNGHTATTQCSPQHFDAHDIQRLFTKDFFSYSFLFVRNPYTKLESEYRFLFLMKSLDRFQQNLFPLPVFSDWIKQAIQDSELNPWVLDNHLRPQREFIYPGCDCFKMEDGILNGLKVVAQKIGAAVPSDLPILNHTREILVETAWTDEARMLVGRHYARDFKEFGYSN